MIPALYALPIPGGILAAGTMLVAQALTSDSLGELIGGGVLLTVGVLALRMVLAAAKHEREAFASLEAQYLKRITDLEEDLTELRTREAECRAALDAERELRQSLEAAGIRDRRRRSE